MKSLVSVVIPMYNAARTIQRALDSVLIQNYEPLEVVVVDDGSRDDSREIVARCPDPRVRLVALASNQGAAAALNAAIEAAQGEYIAFQDADDEWLPGKLAPQVKMMKEDSSLMLVITDCLFFSENGTLMGRCHERYRPVTGPQAWKTLLAYSFISQPTAIARKRDILAAGGFSPELRFGYDQDLWVRLAARGAVGVIPEVLAHIHNQPTSLMHTFHSREGDVILARMERLLHQFRDRLANDEVRAILGSRSFRAAANMYCSRDYAASVPLFWRSVLCGYRPVKSLASIPRAAVMATVKAAFGRSLKDLKSGTINAQ